MPKPVPLVWRTEKRRVNDLLPYEKNPRKITDTQMEGLKESLMKFNLAEIPAINLDGKIAAGHQRIKALQLLGRGEEEIGNSRPQSSSSTSSRAIAPAARGTGTSLQATSTSIRCSLRASIQATSRISSTTISKFPMTTSTRRKNSQRSRKPT
jgi:hypothetical protein